ncbi:IS3 family transposase [Cetobacterium ceti]
MPTENSFSHFKSESIYLNTTKNYYNNKRIPKKLNNLSPIEYRTKIA